MAINWTTDQKNVIETRGKNILVSAAAGSGKTTVLAERVIREITDPEHPIDVDRILILTFTRAAAREMKAKITKNLTSLAEKNPSDENIRRQLTLIHKAEITTIDSFCISVYKNYFEDIGADPKKKIVTDDELAIIRDHVMDDLLEKKYEEGDEAFLNLTALFARNDLFSGLKDAVYTIVGKASAAPWPLEFFDSLHKPYEIENVDDFLNSDYAAFVVEITDTKVRDIVADYDSIKRELDSDDTYLDNLLDELENFQVILNKGTFDEKREALNSAIEGFGKLPGTSKSSDLYEKHQAIQARRNADKKVLTSLRDSYYKYSVDEILQVMSLARPHAETLVSLTKEFYVNYQKEKDLERVMDFSDAEHMALSILVDEHTKERRPAAIELSQYFEEIMVDEYQDSNDLQEAILKSVTTETENRGNYFCVGDVKQSIYAFRNANPALFNKKYDEYEKETRCNKRILLNENFRSRSEVTNAVNDIFLNIMKKDLGKIEYGTNEKLNFAADFDEPDDTMKPEIHVLKAIDRQDGVMKALPAAREHKAEAEMVAQIIEGLMRDLMIKDGETGEKRHVGYGDIAILSRTLSKEMGIIASTLEEHHIPHVLAEEVEFFETVEIRPVVAFLKLIGNRRDDIAVASVLKSPFYHVSDEMLLKIRHAFMYAPDQTAGKTDEDNPDKKKKIPFYTAVKLYAEAHPENSVLSSFFSDLRRYRKAAREMSIKDLITKIYDTGYLDIMTAYPAGEERRANLLAFLDIAAEYEKDNFKGVYRFNKYIELRKKYGVSTNAEAFAGKSEVTVMTIHKSKGLEFPVVILFEAGKDFRKERTDSGILIDREHGLFVDAFDSDRRIREKTFFMQIDMEMQHQEKIAEEQRLLYVALTRAKEKLIITGTVKDKQSALEDLSDPKDFEYREKYNKSLPLSKGVRQSANNYFDFILPIALSDEYKNDFDEIHEYTVKDIEGDAGNAELNSYEGTVAASAEHKNGEGTDATSAGPSEYDLFLQDLKEYERSGDKTFENEIEDRLAFSYPFAYEVSYKTKYSVTEIRDAYTREEFEETENLYPNADYDDRDYSRENADISAITDIQKNVQTGASENPKNSVTNDVQKNEQEISRNGNGENSVIPQNFRPTVPEFLQEKHALTGNKRGTAVHRFMECFDFARDDFRDIYESELSRMTKSGMLSAEAAASISRDEIERFLQNSLAERMHLAAKENHLFREKAFMAKEKISELMQPTIAHPSEITHEDFTPQQGCNATGDSQGHNATGDSQGHSDNEVMVQGIIDAFFIEGDHIVLLDYKTDKTHSAKKLKDEYFKQLDIYRDVLSRALKLPVTEMMLYSFTIGSEIPLL